MGDCGVHWLFRKKIARLLRLGGFGGAAETREAVTSGGGPPDLYEMDIRVVCDDALLWRRLRGPASTATKHERISDARTNTSVPRGPPGCRPVRSARKSRALPTGYCHAWPYLRCERRPHASVEGLGARALPKMLAGLSHRLKARQPSRSHLSDPAVEVASDPLAGRRTRVPALEAARGILQTSATIRALAGDFGSLF